MKRRYSPEFNSFVGATNAVRVDRLKFRSQTLNIKNYKKIAESPKVFQNANIYEFFDFAKIRSIADQNNPSNGMKKNKISNNGLSGKEVQIFSDFRRHTEINIFLCSIEKKKILGSRVGNGPANNIFYAQIDRLDTDRGRCLFQFSMFADRR